LAAGQTDRLGGPAGGNGISTPAACPTDTTDPGSEWTSGAATLTTGAPVATIAPLHIRGAQSDPIGCASADTTVAATARLPRGVGGAPVTSITPATTIAALDARGLCGFSFATGTTGTTEIEARGVCRV